MLLLQRIHTHMISYRNSKGIGLPLKGREFSRVILAEGPPVTQNPTRSVSALPLCPLSVTLRQVATLHNILIPYLPNSSLFKESSSEGIQVSQREVIGGPSWSSRI